MKKYLLIIAFTLIYTIGFGQNDANAKKLLDGVYKTIEGYDNVFIDFEYELYNVKEKVEQKNTGNATLQDDKYKVNLFGTTQIFDGKKTYTIIPDNEEINISNYEEESENTLTPSKFYSFYQKGFNFKMLDKKTVDGKTIQNVELIPIDGDSDTDHIVIGVDMTKNHIYNIVETGKNGTKTTLTVKKFLTNQNLPQDTFSVDTKKYESQGYLINN